MRGGERAGAELIGREGELETLGERLRERRLVTVIGPGGIGKTALARAAAARAEAAFQLGLRTVDLTRAGSPGDVQGAVAAQLGARSFRALLDAPPERSVLLLVDNCEHVSDAAAEAVARLLEASAAPTVLATGRAPLDLPGEAVLILGSLALPPPGALEADAPAVRLFLERARDAGVPVAARDLEAVCAICRGLDGVPLALELAAARTRSMAPQEVLARLDAQLDVLARPRFRGAARHRSLRATIAWSHGMLAPAERRLFARLGVLAGPFTLDAAHAVAAEPGASPAETALLVGELVSSSLLIAEADGAATWYRLLQPLRAFALEELDALGERDASSERLVAHAVSVARGVVEGHDRHWQSSQLVRLLGLYDNLAAALRACLARDREPERALLLLAVLWGVVHQGRTADVAEVGERVLSRWPDAAAPWWPDAAATVATARYLLGRHEEAVRLAREALEAPGRALLAPVTLRRVLGQARRAAGDREGALALFAEAARRARTLGAGALAIELDAFAAEMRATLGRSGEALAELRGCARAAAGEGSDALCVWARTVENRLRLQLDPAAAVDAIEATLAEARRIAYPAGIAANLGALALCRLVSGRPEEAAAAAHALLDELAASGAVGLLRASLEIAAAVLHRQGVSAWADVAATARTLPRRGGLVGELPPELLPTEPARAGPLPVREAVSRARRALRASLADADGGPRAPEAPPRAVFRRDGELWEVVFAERSAYLKPSKGLEDLARLLAEPGREIHCLDLAGAAVEESSLGEVLDDVARRAFEERMRELRAELEEAEAHNDPGRAERARAELDALAEQLAAALGLGGRGRREGGTAERARSAVTQRIRAAVRRIAEAHPRLGRHLEASVRTGAWCVYRPEEPVAWTT